MFCILSCFARIFFSRRSLFALSFISVLSFPTYSQKKSASLTSAQAIEDIEWLERLIKDVHISPYLLYPEKEFTTAFEALKKKFADSENISRYSLYAQILPVFHKMKDIHLSLFLPKKVNDYKQQGKFLLNLRINISEEKLFSITTDFLEMPYGSRILSINGITDSLIIVGLRSVVPSEGINTSTQDKLAARSFREIFPLLFEVYQQNVIEYNSPGSEHMNTVVINAVKAGKYSANVHSERNERNYFKLKTYNTLNTAYIQIPSFSEGSTSDFSEFLKFVFHYLHKDSIDNLIIDFRENEGGYALRGEMLLSYLVPFEIPYISNIIFKKSKMADEIFDRLSRNSPFLKRMLVLDELMKLENSSYGTYDTVYYGNIKPHGFVFSGKLYILMNGLSVSTTGLVCNSLRLHRGALFIGEPGGFTPQGTFGQAIRFTLPNSGIAGYMSTIRFNSTNDFIIDSIPFMPDIHVNETIEDILEGRDPVLEKTLEIIRRKQE